MNSLEFTGLIFAGSLLAGFLGALTGLGGGVVIVPLLAVIFHVDIHDAIGAALVSVIATSSGAASAYVREGYSNIRVGMFLEMATTTGALVWARSLLSPTRTSSPRTKPSTWTAESNNITSFVFVRRDLCPSTHSTTIRYRPSPRSAGSSPSANLIAIGKRKERKKSK
jgi:hypothetical protein